ncbi:MAG: NAD(P)(+) transhydrogenase (Re/Si-specific) subunit beta [Deltaproteobacteria bacterium]|nr:NAD(P)(+) transhydrogenase (Re/Si-specific) subunit beta [Deltaproteobacteria bacterium]
MNNLIQIAYFLTAALFIIGLQRMSSPRSARSGIRWAGGAMLLAVIITFFWPGMHNYFLMIIAVVTGTLVAWIFAKRVSMTDMPQMIAIYNGMGGGAAGAIGAQELIAGSLSNNGMVLLAVCGGLIGAVAFSGSLIAFARLQGIMGSRPTVFAAQQPVNLLCLGIAALAGLWLILTPGPALTGLFFLFALLFGVLMTLPIGGGDMPVVISLYNALTGLAVACEGFAIGNAALIVAGTVVGAAGTLLTLLMAKAMNRTIANVLFGAFGQESTAAQGEVHGSLKAMEIEDAAILMAYAEKVVIAPGYGMAVAQAQHKVKELTTALEHRGIKVKFAIHPVAGRMPGHMNVLLAEAGIDYEQLFDLEEVNPEFSTTDVSLVIGANDVVNPAARTNAASPIYGMPILNVDDSKNVLVIKRGKGKGFAGIENELFFADNTRMVYGDAQEVVNTLVQSLKQL